MKALKIVNSMSGSSMDEADLKRHRANVELACKLAAHKADISIKRFKVCGIPCEAVIPEFAHNPCYVILYAHGGGYVSGGLWYARILAAKMALATGFTTVSFDYRLAPENPYPAALDDGLAVWEYLSKDKYLPDHILFAGDSAGGNLVLCMTQRLLAEGKTPPSQLLLFSPWTDMTGNSESYKTNEDIDPILTKRYVMDASKAYIAGFGDPENASFSPLFGSFENFPSTLIMAGQNEILLDDSKRLYDKITENGGKAVLDIEEKGWHVYQQMPIPLAGRAMKRLSAYVSKEIYAQKI